jgi:antitoxin HigA-1
MDGKISEEVAREERVNPPIHPGRIIELEWLEPLGISAYELAKAAGVPKQRIYALIRGERGITADTALRLSRTLGMPPDFWMGLQTDYALEMVEWEEGAQIEKETRPLVAG